MATSSSLESSFSRVPLARLIARSSGDEVKGAAAVSWSPVLPSRATPATHFGCRYDLHRWT